MVRFLRLAVALLGGLSLLSACTGGSPERLPSHSASTRSPPATGALAETSNQVQPELTFQPVGAQVSEVLHLERFLGACNAGQLDTALAQFSHSQMLGFSDCDYHVQQVVAGHGRAQLANWLQTNISRNDRLIGATIVGGTPDEPVLGVSFNRRTSESITRSGHPDGITPSLAAKVKFDSNGLITEFNNGPGGGPPDACRIG